MDQRLPQARSQIQVIARAAAILRTLENQAAGLSLGQIAQRVNLARSTVQRIVAALQAEKLLASKDPDTDFDQVQSELKRATARLETARHHQRK